jgi:hypothetical protein
MFGAKRGANRSANFVIQSSENSNFAPCFWPKVPIFLFKSSARKKKIKFEKNRESSWTRLKKVLHACRCLKYRRIQGGKFQKKGELNKAKTGPLGPGVPV